MLDQRIIHRHFRRADPTMAEVVRRIGPMTLRPQRDRFRMLVRSILSQQISTAAARTIRRRLEEHLGADGVRPESLARMTPAQFRALGVSRQKAGYLRDLAGKCRDGQVRLARLGRLDDEQVIAELTQVRGIGRWSAQMFLIFSLGRLDVFPHDDLGVRSAIRRLYGFAQLPGKDQCLAIGQRWRPYATVGSWYCWRFLEL